MRGFSGLLIVAGIAVAIVLGGGLFYIVPEYQQVVITQFGQPIGKAVTDAGLHMKTPFVQQAHYFEERLLEWDGIPTEIPTKDKKFILIDETARWRISDPLLFYQSVGTHRGALTRLRDAIASATRDVITTATLQQVVRSSNRILEIVAVEQTETGAHRRQKLYEPIQIGRKQLTRMILERASELTPKYGIELVDMRIKRINYVESVQREVFQRMIAERKRAAEQYRSEGQGKKAEIEGEMEKELKRITSEAYRTAQELKGTADAESTAIYADAYSKDPKFYAFLKTLETYRETINQDSTIILSTDSTYFKYLKKLSGP